MNRYNNITRKRKNTVKNINNTNSEFKFSNDNNNNQDKDKERRHSSSAIHRPILSLDDISTSYNEMKEKRNKIISKFKKEKISKKKETSSEDLCLGFPDEFRQFVEYTRNLEYTEQPDYDRLKSSFYNLVTKKMGENFDFKYDWTTESDLKKRKDNDYIDLAAPSTNYPVSEKKSTQKEMSINSKKIIPQPVNSEKEGN